MRGEKGERKMEYPSEYEGFEKTEENRRIREAYLSLLVRYSCNRYTVDLLQEDHAGNLYLLVKRGDRAVLSESPRSKQEAWEMIKEWIDRNKLKASVS
jgi:hypothetical protein